jgi:hypothetical protein
MSVVTVAICIVAAALAGLAWLIGERIPLPAWACAALAILVALLAFAAGPKVLGG